MIKKFNEYKLNEYNVGMFMDKQDFGFDAEDIR